MAAATGLRLETVPRLESLEGPLPEDHLVQRYRQACEARAGR